MPRRRPSESASPWGIAAPRSELRHRGHHTAGDGPGGDPGDGRSSRSRARRIRRHRANASLLGLRRDRLEVVDGRAERHLVGVRVRGDVGDAQEGRELLEPLRDLDETLGWRACSAHTVQCEWGIRHALPGQSPAVRAVCNGKTGEPRTYTPRPPPGIGLSRCADF
eukprot:4478513-Prymnesium_polylepis.1